MSTYVTRIVQVKKNYEWVTVPLYTNIKPDYEVKPDFTHNNIDYYNINKRCSNFIYGRDIFRDEWTTPWDEYGPDLEYYIDYKGDQQILGYNFGMVIVNDIYNKVDELDSKYLEYIKKLKNSKLEDKVNKLLSHFDIPFDSSEESYSEEDLEWINEEYLFPSETLYAEASFAKDIAEEIGVYSSFDVRICFYFD